MCGIAGILDLKGVTGREDLLRMTDCLAHRGPDGSGIWREGPVGLGHRRLSIIDPESGHQPMATPDGRLHISYNGELYNFRELRRELEEKGHRFRTSSDTEVVLEAWRRWGPDCVLHFRGMFAFGVVDINRGLLFLARDHFGIKPLIYTRSPGFFAFASELQALKILPFFEDTISREALDDYLQLDTIPPPRTIYRAASKLAPGHRMSISLDDGSGEPEAYWTPRFRPEYGRPAEDWLEELDDVLSESVRAHLVADVPFGAFLSGGLDSTLVVGYMARLLDQPVQCYTIGFEEKTFDERDWARTAADTWGVEHQVRILKPDALEILPELVRHYGEPFADSSAVPTFYLARLASGSVPMVLSGDGGDEFFAGYRSYEGWMRWITWEGRPRWRKLLYPLMHHLRPHRYLPRSTGAEAWLGSLAKSDDTQRRNLWRRELEPGAHRVPDAFREAFRGCENLDPLQAVQLADIQTYLPNDILTKVDIASMMSSLEVRTPLVDLRVAELAFRLPPQINFHRKEEGGFEGKLLLKKLLSRHFPDSFVHRRKQGFGVPVSDWFGSGGEAQVEVRERLLDPSSPLLEYFRPGGVADQVRKGTGEELWKFLFLDEWLRQR